jgi:hypothetical protein
VHGGWLDINAAPHCWRNTHRLSHRQPSSLREATLVLHDENEGCLTASLGVRPLVVCSVGGDGILLEPLQQNRGEVAVALQAILELLGGEQQADWVVLAQTCPSLCPAQCQARRSNAIPAAVHGYLSMSFPPATNLPCRLCYAPKSFRKMVLPPPPPPPPEGG